MVPGAKLRREMELIGNESAFDVAGHVASSGRTFSNLINEVEDMVIRARPGSDILVGLEGSQPPPLEYIRHRHFDRIGTIANGRMGGVYEAVARTVHLPARFGPFPGHQRGARALDTSSRGVP